jgi:hypothetical protein
MGSDEDDPAPADAGRRSEAFDRELTLVEGALTLVGSGVAPNVTLVGLGGGHGLLRLAMELGDRAGLAVRAWRHTSPDRYGDERFDMLVEPRG